LQLFAELLLHLLVELNLAAELFDGLVELFKRFSK